MNYDSKVPKTPAEIIIYTKNFMVTGIAHILPNERLTDMLDSSRKAFIPITDATIFNINDHRVVGRTKFLSLNKNEIVIIYPKEDDLP